MAQHLHDHLREAIPILDGGDADIWALFREVALFRRVMAEMAAPFQGDVDVVIGAESRGFVMGQALAQTMGLPFVAVRKAKGFLPGEVYTQQGLPDYKGEQSTFRLQKHALQPGQRILFSDDWLETGSQAMSIKALVEQAGATWVGVTTIVDQTSPERRAELGRYHAIITNKELFADREQKAYRGSVNVASAGVTNSGDQYE